MKVILYVIISLACVGCVAVSPTNPSSPNSSRQSAIAEKSSPTSEDLKMIEASTLFASIIKALPGDANVDLIEEQTRLMKVGQYMTWSGDIKPLKPRKEEGAKAPQKPAQTDSNAPKARKDGAPTPKTATPVDIKTKKDEQRK